MEIQGIQGGQREKSSSPQQAAEYLERNCAGALPAFALTSYGAVTSPFLPAIPPAGQGILAKANESVGD
jgi:hypothetical protein